MKNVYSVGQVNNYIKNMFTQDFMLSRIYVKGEVSNCKYHTSGHIYFSLKDETGTIACVMFAGARKGLAFRMQDGQKVVALGSVNVYERDGRYQLYAREIILEGAGLLYEKYEALKKELEEMGMFSSQFKQQIPSHIKRLGIVTAPTGAAVRDIMNISRRRNPYVQLVLYPALVQGEGAADSIVKGIRMLDEYGVDTIIVGRGGGSIEDLWAFNEEKVARAIFNCRTPVISAVGHETDVTIADYVADLRAPTPSAAAELAVADVRQVTERLSQYRYAFYGRMTGQIERATQEAKRRLLRLNYLSPENQIREKRQSLIDKEERLQLLMRSALEEKRHQMMIYVERMKGLSPLDKLSQGYSYIADESGRTVTSIDDVSEGERLKVYVTDGYIRAEVAGKEKMTWQKKKN
ncbi:exodeoxyribonuclease VII large subunit [Murimonas intestini]|uniref:Exodeoxyribonuclease 7 large subunit n=1 Tax=Murimonas intestini TaxID=1337051 RepID=A0AB73T7A3_9FIRM|nr:exodeoxyribonuclease VII large subunit [Murimonas intestini]MCR1841261.1 exodeoxyribonuclease VII large subunit [Murimonas intestini]MCR1866179.1 exodeoxyribonuclease VII large subunit [Murimonas intestini]MCR1882704.1 exodeoxyribonuclease VII large subunit [Murimonas intestini]